MELCDMIFPTFVRASHESALEQEELELTNNNIDNDNTHTKETKKQKSLLQLVIEANGQLSRVPQRTPAERSHFSKTLETEQQYYEQHHISQDHEDNQEHGSQPVIITHTSWTPPTYLLDACFNTEFITRYYNMHGITCSRLQPSSSINSAKHAHAEYNNRNSSQGYSNNNKYNNNDDNIDNQDNMYTNTHSQLPPPPLLRLHDLQLPTTVLNNLQRMLLRRNNHTSFSTKTHNFIHVKQNNNKYDDNTKFEHKHKSVSFTGIQSCALPNALLGDHVMFCGPPTCGKTTAALLATACNLLSAQNRLTTTATSSLEQVSTNANNGQEELENLQGMQHHTTIRSAQDDAFTDASMKSNNEHTTLTSNSQVSPQGLIFVSSFQHLLQCVRWLCDTFGNDAFSFYTFARNSTSLEPFQLRGAKYMTTNNTFDNQRCSVNNKNDMNNNINANKKEENNLHFVYEENGNEYTQCLEPSFAELLSLVHGAADKNEETERDNYAIKNNNSNNIKVQIESMQECREHCTRTISSEEEHDRLIRHHHMSNDNDDSNKRRKRSSSGSIPHSSHRHRHKRDRERYSREHSSSNSAHRHSSSVHHHRHRSNHHHHHRRHHHSEHSSEQESKEHRRHDRYDEYDSKNRKHSSHHYNTDHHHHDHRHEQKEFLECNKYTHDSPINDYNNSNNLCEKDHITSLPEYTNNTHNAKRPDATWKCLSSRIPLLFCTFHAFTEALQLTDNNCALLPLEHVKIVTIMQAERLLSLSSFSASLTLLPSTSLNNTNDKNITSTTNKQHSGYSAWLGLSNAVDVECQYLLTCNRNEIEVKEIIQNTLLPDAGDRLVTYTQHDETIWQWCKLRIEPVTVQVENSNNKNDNYDNNDDNEEWTKQKAERGYVHQDATQRERTSARHKVSSEDIDVAKITHTATLVIEHLIELSEMSSHETSQHEYTGLNETNKLNRNEQTQFRRSNIKNINSVEDVTAFSESVHSPLWMPQVVIFVATRREHQLLLDQLSRVLRESAHLHPRAALLQITDNLYNVFVEHTAHVAIVTDVQLTDDKIFGILTNSLHAQYTNLMHTDDRYVTIADHPFYNSGNKSNSDNNNNAFSLLLCIHFSLPRQILHNAVPEQIREVMAFRMRALLGRTHDVSNYFCLPHKEDNNNNNNLYSNNNVISKNSSTYNSNKINVVLLMTEHHMRGVIGTRIEKALHWFLHKSISLDDEL